MKETDNMKLLLKKLRRIENQLEKVRGKEYSLVFGSMARARVSRKWDMLAKEKFELQGRVEDAESK